MTLFSRTSTFPTHSSLPSSSLLRERAREQFHRTLFFFPPACVCVRSTAYTRTHTAERSSSQEKTFTGILLCCWRFFLFLVAAAWCKQIFLLLLQTLSPWREHSCDCEEVYRELLPRQSSISMEYIGEGGSKTCAHGVWEKIGWRGKMFFSLAGGRKLYHVKCKMQDWGLDKFHPSQICSIKCSFKFIFMHWIIDVPGVPEFGVCFLNCFPFHY